MSVQSQFSDAQIESLPTELIAVFEKKQVSTKLALVVLGNILTYFLNTQLSPHHRQQVMDSFLQALQQSIIDETEQ